MVYRFATGKTWDGGVERVARLLGGVHALPGHGFRSLPVDGGAILADGDRFLRIDRGGEIRARPAAVGALRSGRTTRSCTATPAPATSSTAAPT